MVSFQSISAFVCSDRLWGLGVQAELLTVRDSCEEEWAAHFADESLAADRRLQVRNTPFLAARWAASAQQWLVAVAPWTGR
jgi:hypothetical protein